ncbi:hypothetical protein MMC26_001241 [Xylographa opegraphella]|nr:hypothetical protein [Xylographa opegraphella]
MGTPIPQPPGLPILGNVRDLDPANTLDSVLHLIDQYGPIFKLNIAGNERLVASSYELLNELCDEKRFAKQPSGGLLEIRNGAGDGLFTAFGDEENWGLAHRILMPAFGPMAIRSMYDEMLDIATQLVSKWARYGPENKISVTDDFTRLTLDSIALCALDARFNSFYREGMHPFVDAMVYFLAESGARASRPAFVTNYIYRDSTRKYWESIELMKSISLQVIKDRRAHPTDKNDLVNTMLFGKDPRSGKTLSDENIVHNMITFLVAGHETTSGLLSFLFALFLKYPETYNTAQKEVDEVVGKGSISYEHMSKLPYLTACLRETLRLYPTAPGFSVAPISKDRNEYPIYIGKERYEVHFGQPIGVILPRIHRDPAVWGEDAEVFKPERMLEEKFSKLPPNAWKPFGNGTRACIGRAFAWQEAHIVVAMLLQNFNFRRDDPSYEIHWKQTLTIKPKDFYMYATLREGVDPIGLEKTFWNNVDGGKSTTSKETKIPEKNPSSQKPRRLMTILYGSNTGTCESLARTLANSASSRGYKSLVQTLDSAADKIPKDQPVVIITASYEGQPTDNATYFMEWLQGLKDDRLDGVKYAVFGCGHRDWQATFQKIPTAIDNLFETHGSKRLAARGNADAADNDIFNNFDSWVDHTLWPGIAAEYGVEDEDPSESQGLDVEISTNTRSNDLRQDVSEAIVKDVKILTAPGEPEKRHIELQLPTNMTYRAGDYLAVLPLNSSEIVKRVMKRFSLPWDSKINIKEGQNTILPCGRDMSVFDLLSAYVELNQPATTKNVAAIASSIPDPTLRSSLLATPSSLISSQRLSPLYLLEAHPTATLPFHAYLSMLPPMRVRQYSISSSPLFSPTTCTLTYAVVDAPAPSLPSSTQASESRTDTSSDETPTSITNCTSALPFRSNRSRGVATTYLASLTRGDHLLVSVRTSHTAFHPPLDISSVPMILICAGSGLAPFRGFIQERAAHLSAHRPIAPCILFIGCRAPTLDALYATELQAWQAQGAVTSVRYAFSRRPAASDGCRYVQDRVWRDRADVRDLWDRGARVYVCGSGELGEGVRACVVRIAMEAEMGWGRERAEEWFRGVGSERFASDVFA